MQRQVVEFLITDSLAGAIHFARILEWDIIGPTLLRHPTSDVIVVLPDEEERMFGHARAIVHVGYFRNTPVGRAARKQLMSVGEARRMHVIPYELTADTAEPLRFCLICGAKTPCMWKEDLQPGEPSLPCVFDPTPLQLLQRIRFVEAQNAQLRQDLTALAGQVEVLEESHQRHGEEIDKITHALKAYRLPQRNAS